MSGPVFYQGKRVPIKAWVKGVTIEDSALAQLENVSSLPFVFRQVAAMADCHWGIGCTVGSVIATQGAIIPAAVGVDIGCGMLAVKTNLVASDLPDNLHAMRTEIERLVPHGRTADGKEGDRGAWHNLSPRVEAFWQNSIGMHEDWDKISGKHPRLERSYKRASNQLGTLGTGNHFIEVCLDELQCVWIMLHSGSRGIGNAIGRYFIERAKERMREYYITLPDADLAYLPDGTQDFKDYIEAVEWAQNYALANRHLMLQAVKDAIENVMGRPIFFAEEAVNCHHNYVARERHFGQNVIVTRNGAVSAQKDQLGIIPGSMGTGSFIVRGLGERESFCSCSHGAGRKMSRGAAKKLITLEDHAIAMKGIEARLGEDVLDESPAAYKDVNQVMEAQEDLVEIVTRLRQVLNVKG